MRDADTAVDAAAAAPWGGPRRLVRRLRRALHVLFGGLRLGLRLQRGRLGLRSGLDRLLRDSSTASSVLRSASWPSDSTILTSCWIVADSSSRARAMYCPVVRNHWIARGDPSSSARSAYSRTCGDAVTRMVVTCTRRSSWSASYCPVLRNDRSAKSVPAVSASEDSRFTALPPCALTVVTATRRSSCTADWKPPAR
ncbi:hypothetical protein STENM223S_11576 [Streptomyces tendae]